MRNQEEMNLADKITIENIRKAAELANQDQRKTAGLSYNHAYYSPSQLRDIERTMLSAATKAQRELKDIRREMYSQNYQSWNSYVFPLRPQDVWPRNLILKEN